MSEFSYDGSSSDFGFVWALPYSRRCRYSCHILPSLVGRSPLPFWSNIISSLKLRVKLKRVAYSTRLLPWPFFAVELLFLLCDCLGACVDWVKCCVMSISWVLSSPSSSSSDASFPLLLLTLRTSSWPSFAAASPSGFVLRLFDHDNLQEGHSVLPLLR